jgi:hypothetical protein
VRSGGQTDTNVLIKVFIANFRCEHAKIGENLQFRILFGRDAYEILCTRSTNDAESSNDITVQICKR